MKRLIQILLSNALLGALTPITAPSSPASVPEKPDGASAAVATVLAAKVELIEAARAKESVETGRQIALILRILETNPEARAVLATPTEHNPPRSKLFSGFVALP